MIANLFLMGMLIAYLAVYSGLFAWLNNKFSLNLASVKRFAAPALWLITDWLRLGDDRLPLVVVGL